MKKGTFVTFSRIMSDLNYPPCMGDYFEASLHNEAMTRGECAYDELWFFWASNWVVQIVDDCFLKYCYF